MMDSPEGMIGVELFAARNSMKESEVIDLIKAGSYYGKKVGDDWFIVDEFYNGVSTSEASVGEAVNDAASNPLLANALFVLSVLSLLGGLFMCAELWPSGYVRSSQKVAAYTPAVQWLVLGVVQFVVLAALGQVLVYLKQIKSGQ